MSAMPQEQQAPRMTETEYLAFERASDIKHEYINGYIYAMAGAKRNHSLITGKTITALNNGLSDCDVYTSDTRVRISASKYVYPDASVVCGESQFAENEFDNLLNPTVIVEVLSPSTEAFDRGDKFQYYRGISSLKEYILISQDKARIEGFVRQDSGLWTFNAAIGLSATYELSVVDCTLELASIYQRISFERAEDES